MPQTIDQNSVSVPLHVSGAPAPVPQFIQGRQSEAKKIYIASVHFLDLKRTLPNQLTYPLPAPKKGQVSYLAVTDSYQMVPDTTDHEHEYGMVKVPMPITAESIAENLVRDWTASYIGAAAKYPPAIRIVPTVPADPEIVKAMLKKEHDHCMALVDEADGIITSRRLGNPTNLFVNANHRKALEWVGSEKRDWFKPVEPGKMKKSVATGARIPEEALVDGGLDLLELYIKHDIDPREYEDQHCFKLLQDKGRVATIKKRLGMA